MSKKEEGYQNKMAYYTYRRINKGYWQLRNQQDKIRELYVDRFIRIVDLGTDSSTGF